MPNLLSRNLVANVGGGGAPQQAQQLARVWLVFFLCLIFSGIGVCISFFVFQTAITGVKLWGFGLIIAVVMLGVSYGAKYANDDARRTFTPMDFVQYLSQGFLWPSTWPQLAGVLGIATVPGPGAVPSGKAVSWLGSHVDLLAQLVS